MPQVVNVRGFGDMVLVTKVEYPVLFDAFEIISHDCGEGCGHTNYAIPAKYLVQLKEYDTYLSYLSIKELETICIGDDREVQVLIEQSPRRRLALVHNFLNKFFEDFPEDF